MSRACGGLDKRGTGPGHPLVPRYLQRHHKPFRKDPPHQLGPTGHTTNRHHNKNTARLPSQAFVQWDLRSGSAHQTNTDNCSKLCFLKTSHRELELCCQQLAIGLRARHNHVESSPWCGFCGRLTFHAEFGADVLPGDAELNLRATVAGNTSPPKVLDVGTAYALQRFFQLRPGSQHLVVLLTPRFTSLVFFRSSTKSLSREATLGRRHQRNSSDPCRWTEPAFDMQGQKSETVYVPTALLCLWQSRPEGFAHVCVSYSLSTVLAVSLLCQYPTIFKSLLLSHLQMQPWHQPATCVCPCGGLCCRSAPHHIMN